MIFLIDDELVVSSKYFFKFVERSNLFLGETYKFSHEGEIETWLPELRRPCVVYLSLSPRLNHDGHVVTSSRV
jgi:hypothetical protein